MPSIEVTVSAWWAVAAVVQLVWLFGIVRPCWSWLDNHVRRDDWQAHRRWKERWEPVGMFIAGPLVWVAWAVEAFEQWRTRRRRKRTEAAEEIDQ